MDGFQELQDGFRRFLKRHPFGATFGEWLPEILPCCGETQMRVKEATFRFYEELNDFLPAARRKRDFTHFFHHSPTLKDSIESLGVPHPEVDLILVNGISRRFDDRLSHRDRVAVYPMFESLDISSLTRLRPYPLRSIRFVLDVHLGKTARWLRLLGFDSQYRNDYEDMEIVEIALRERRIILTRDRGLLMMRKVTHGYWVRSPQPFEQLREIMVRFDLGDQIRPFRRCMCCNDPIENVTKDLVLDQLQPKTRAGYSTFFRCRGCGKVYWRGPHWEEMSRQLARILPNTVHSALSVLSAGGGDSNSGFSPQAI